MYKMLVVDDEYLVRMGITETVDWASIGAEVIDSAVNGKDGLEKVHTLKPDIIISDVKMPIMSGVQMVTTLHQENYDGIFIMLSGYNDFDYAKSALEAGVFRYLLKPIDNEELLSVVGLAIEKLEKKRKQESILADLDVGLPVIKAKLVNDLFHGIGLDNIRSKLSLYDLPIIEKGIVFYCKAENEEDKVDTDKEIALALSLLEKEILLMLNEHKSVYSCTAKRIAFATDVKDVELLALKLKGVLSLYEKKSKILISIGISNPFNSLDEISSAFGTAKYLAYNKLFTAINSVNVANKEAKTYKRHIVEALQYISAHFRECDLKIKVIADSLFVSESYLMHLFKKELGKTFNTCLTEYRIMEARRLLEEQKYRVYEIAEMVGYSDMKYFGQVFRRMEGCSPSEYAKKHE